MKGLEMQLLAEGTDWKEWDMFDTTFLFDGCYLNSAICEALDLDYKKQYALGINFETSTFSVYDPDLGEKLGTGNLQISPINVKKSVDTNQ